MTISQNLIVTPQTPKLWSTSIGNGDTTNAFKRLLDKPASSLGAGVNGAKITSIFVTSDDTSSRILQFAIARGETVTTPVASPGLVNWTNHGLIAGDLWQIFGGTLPTGLTANTPYWVIAGGLTSAVFEVATAAGGSAVNFTGTSSGTQTGLALRIVGSFTVAITAGQDGSTSTMQVLTHTNFPGLPIDNDGNPYVFLESGDYLAVAATTQVTANKIINVTAIGANF